MHRNIVKRAPRKALPNFGISAALFVAACSSAQSDNGEIRAPELPPSAPLSPQPEFGPLIQQEEPPPPISGGTLAVSRTEPLAVAADSDRDRVYVVDLASRAIRHTIQLAPKSEPGRVALDMSGRAHVALRNTGEIATIDLATGTVTLRFACSAPRGVTFDPKSDTIYVACATGDLLAFPTAGGAPVRHVTLDRDLRDVIVTRTGLYTTRFRTARLVTVGDDGKAERDFGLGTSNLAWRAVAAPVDPAPGSQSTEPAPPPPEDARAIVTQDPAQEPVRPEPGGYGSGSGGGKFQDFECSGVGIVSTRLWLVGGSPNPGSVKLPSAVLPVDLATNGREFVVVAAGNAHTPSLPQLFIVHRDQLSNGTQECVATVQGNVPGQAVAAGFDSKDALIVQTREPAALHIMTDDRRRPVKTITLAEESREDTGHAIFHSNAGGNLACASCHPEGQDDGHVWEFVGMGPRRTPSLRGTTRHTEPFHWNGDMKDLGTLVQHVFVERMSGPRIDKPQVDVLGNFLFKLPAPPKLRQPADVAPQGKELFTQRCASCHAGESLTNNKTVDVGTGGSFQVPSLIGVGWRAPYLHTGCATTLFDRFDPACGGIGHGDTKDLAKSQIADIIDYLETL